MTDMNNKVFPRLRKFFWIDLIKTIYVNLRLLPFVQAVKLPIIVTYSTTIGSLKGKVQINSNCHYGLVRFGFLHSDLISWKEKKTYLNIQGRFVVNGQIQFGVGCKINIDKKAELVIGDNVAIGFNTKIICREKIKIGNNFRTAWDVQITDTNFHYIKDTETGLVKNRTKPITIGNNNWIGNRSSIMQGTNTPDFFIVASNSLCNKDFTKELSKYSLVGGCPAKLIKSNVCRVLDKEEREIEKFFFEKNKDFILVDKTPRAR